MDEVGFNGAAALQPRKDQPGALRHGADTRFNGAAALQPRKEAYPAADLPVELGFNGAAALQPRKAAGSPWSSPRSAHASMGPRLFSRGRKG